MKMRARKRQIIAAIMSTVRVDLVLDPIVIEAFRKKYPRGIEAGIRDAIAKIKHV